MSGQSDIDAFRDWLVDQGAAFADPTNEYEALRYRLDATTHLIWRRKNGRITRSPTAQKHWDAFAAGEHWDRIKRLGGKRRQQMVHALIERDGHDCWLCGKPLGDDITVEHFLAVARGGTNNPANAALTHEACNARLADLPIVQKVALRDAIRIKETKA